ncbi:MAG: DUF2807 domain-containing protein [Chitinophagales bacterium]|nr:DUF2807 domain-containing protein [Chitinophagales bacterium]
MKKLSALLATVAVAMILVTACNKEKNVVPGSKNHRMDEPAIDVIVEEMEIGSFSRLTSNTNFDVVIVPDVNYSVVVEVQEIQDIAVIDATVTKGGELTIEAPANLTDAVVYVHAPVIAIEEVKIGKNGDVRIDGNYGILKLDMKGNGDAILNGSANQIQIKGGGNGQVDALGMPAIDVVVNMKGNSNTRVAVQNTLDVDLTGNSKVYYSGNPVITKKLKGNAQLIKL